MLLKTHLAILAFALLLMVDSVTYKVAFVAIAVVATFLPDIDNGFSTLGKHAIFRPIQFLTRHRGVIHSFTLCIIVSLFFSVYFPLFALPFFLGYGLHLLVDAFTIEGIKAFWPLRREFKGIVRVGGTIEQTLFLGFCIADIILFVSLFVR
jgi:membrane-bound metal-dependent hydrolase YbcI (DUF457 family)